MAQLGVFDSAYSRIPQTLHYNAPGTTYKLFIAPRNLVITGIQGESIVVGSDGGTVTASFYKCNDGVAAASGTLLHSGTFNLKGTVDVRQQLTLVQAPATLEMKAGDTIAVIFTGTTTAAIGTVQVETEPRN